MIPSAYPVRFSRFFVCLLIALLVMPLLWMLPCAKADGDIQNNEFIQGDSLVSKKLRFSVKRPKGWRFAEASAVHCVLIPEVRQKDSMYLPAIILRTATLQSPLDREKLDQFIQFQMEKNLLDLWVEAKKAESRTLQLGGEPATDLLYEGQGVKDVEVKKAETSKSVVANIVADSVKVKYRTVYQIHGNQLFHIIYGGEQALFEQFLSDFNDFLRSFRHLD